jgi:hypothetical protein
VPRRSPAAERGDSFVVTLVAVVVLLAAFLMATNLIVDQYGQGVVRTAVDEGAQAGALTGSPEGAVAACRAKEAEVMSGLLAGQLGRHLDLTCSVRGEVVTASAVGNMPGWLPPVPAIEVRQLGFSHLETAPTATHP